MQALIFHICYVAVNIVLVIGLAAAMGISGMFEKQVGKPVTPDLYQIILMVIASIIILGFIGSCIGYAIYMAVVSYKGKTKKYPVIGNIVYNKIYASV